MGEGGKGTSAGCHSFGESAAVLAYLFAGYGGVGFDEFAELRCFVRTFFL